MPPYELILFFFLIAMLYSSVGFGGGSSYLALLSLYGFDFKILRLTALACNIVVVSGGSLIFLRNKILRLKDAVPFVVFSIPAAFAGGMIRTSEKTFFITLGMVLLVSGILLWFRKKSVEKHLDEQSPKTWFGAVTGTAIGFLSGFVGIGGGIFLAPVLHFTGWGSAKKIAATSSFFILCNSISGIGGQLLQFENESFQWEIIIPLVLAVLAGGQIGSRISTNVKSSYYIRKTTAVLIVFVGLRLLYVNLNL
jgi:hypothetical protein